MFLNLTGTEKVMRYLRYVINYHYIEANEKLPVTSYKKVGFKNVLRIYLIRY